MVYVAQSVAARVVGVPDEVGFVAAGQGKQVGVRKAFPIVAMPRAERGAAGGGAFFILFDFQVQHQAVGLLNAFHQWVFLIAFNGLDFRDHVRPDVARGEVVVLIEQVGDEKKEKRTADDPAI